MGMDERQRIVREIFLKNGKDRKFPIREEDWKYYDYEEEEVIRKELTRGNLKNLLIDKGYTEEEAKEIIRECWLRNILTIMGIGSSPSQEENICLMINEEHLVKDIVKSFEYEVYEMVKDVGEEIKDYIVDAVFDENDEDEIKLREVYAEQNKKELSKTELIQQLQEKGYTNEEAEQLIQKYTNEEVEKTGRWNVEYLFRKPEYKPLNHHKKIKSKLNMQSEELIVSKISEDYYEITIKEEWQLKEYYEILHLRGRDTIFGTDKVPFIIIKRIFQKAWGQGKKAHTHKELKHKIMEECGVTGEEAEIAIYVAFRTFKITELNQALEKIWKMEHTNELKYFWSGTTNEYPPYTTQDRIFNPIKEIFKEAKKHGKETLTHEELVQEVLKTYRNLQKKHEFDQTRKVNKELAETLIEDAESLLLIETKDQKGRDKTHTWNPLFI